MHSIRAKSQNCRLFISLQQALMAGPPLVAASRLAQPLSIAEEAETIGPGLLVTFHLQMHPAPPFKRDSVCRLLKPCLYMLCCRKIPSLLVASPNESDFKGDSTYLGTEQRLPVSFAR